MSEDLAATEVSLLDLPSKNSFSSRSRSYRWQMQGLQGSTTFFLGNTSQWLTMGIFLPTGDSSKEFLFWGLPVGMAWVFAQSCFFPFLLQGVAPNSVSTSVWRAWPDTQDLEGWILVDRGAWSCRAFLFKIDKLPSPIPKSGERLVVITTSMRINVHNGYIVLGTQWMAAVVISWFLSVWEQSPSGVWGGSGVFQKLLAPL